MILAESGSYNKEEGVLLCFTEEEFEGEKEGKQHDEEKWMVQILHAKDQIHDRKKTDEYAVDAAFENKRNTTVEKKKKKKKKRQDERQTEWRVWNW